MFLFLRAMTYQAGQYKEDIGELAERRVTVDVTVADRRYGDNEKIDALPIR